MKYDNIVFLSIPFYIYAFYTVKTNSLTKLKLEYHNPLNFPRYIGHNIL